MSYLSINCSVAKGFGKLVIVTLENDEVQRHTFTSPSVFSFKRNSAEILNWHRDNIVSLITQFNIKGLVVKKTERDSFVSRLKNSGIFKLYMEGVMLSLAGSVGKPNRHLYKNDIKSILDEPDIFALSIDKICEKFNLKCNFETIQKTEIDTTKEALLAVISLSKLLNP